MTDMQHSRVALVVLPVHGKMHSTKSSVRLSKTSYVSYRVEQTLDALVYIHVHEYIVDLRCSDNYYHRLPIAG